ncbi:MAG: hypothetical protein HUJ61_06185 [Bacilli bacterium]|nr:hypothetical protein [Bacilli bacterium]
MKKRNLLMMGIFSLAMGLIPNGPITNKTTRVHDEKKNFAVIEPEGSAGTISCEKAQLDFTGDNYDASYANSTWDEDNKILYYNVSSQVDSAMKFSSSTISSKCHVKLPADSTIYFFSQYVGSISACFQMTAVSTDQAFFYCVGNLTIKGNAHFQVQMSGMSTDFTFIRSDGTLTFSDDDYYIDNYSQGDDTCKSYFKAENIVVNGRMDLMTLVGGNVFTATNSVTLNSNLDCKGDLLPGKLSPITSYDRSYSHFVSLMKTYRVEIVDNPSTITYVDTFDEALDLIDYDVTSPKKTRIRYNTHTGTSHFKTTTKPIIDKTYNIGDEFKRCDVVFEHGAGTFNTINTIEEGQPIFNLINCDFKICTREDSTWRSYFDLNHFFGTTDSLFISASGECNIYVRDLHVDKGEMKKCLFDTNEECTITFENFRIKRVDFTHGQYGMVKCAKQIILIDTMIYSCFVKLENMVYSPSTNIFGCDEIVLRGGKITLTNNTVIDADDLWYDAFNKVTFIVENITMLDEETEIDVNNFCYFVIKNAQDGDKDRLLSLISSKRTDKSIINMDVPSDDLGEVKMMIGYDDHIITVDNGDFIDYCPFGYDDTTSISLHLPDDTHNKPYWDEDEKSAFENNYPYITGDIKVYDKNKTVVTDWSEPGTYTVKGEILGYSLEGTEYRDNVNEVNVIFDSYNTLKMTTDDGFDLEGTYTYNYLIDQLKINVGDNGDFLIFFPQTGASTLALGDINCDELKSLALTQTVFYTLEKEFTIEPEPTPDPIPTPTPDPIPTPTPKNISSNNSGMIVGIVFASIALLGVVAYGSGLLLYSNGVVTTQFFVKMYPYIKPKGKSKVAKGSSGKGSESSSNSNKS